MPFGMLVAERAEDRWQFALRRYAVAADDGEAAMLLSATRAMPETGMVLGSQLADRVVPPLLDAGTAGQPEMG